MGRGRFSEEKLRKRLFANLPPGDGGTSRVKVSKVFCGAFLQKSDRLLASPWVIAPGNRL
jgi:hypothetical protein